MRNLMRRALDRLTGTVSQEAGAAPQKSKSSGAKAGTAKAGAAAVTGKRPAEADPASAPEPQADAGRTPPTGGGRNALIEKALAIQRDQARIFDELQPAERKRLQALARRTFAPVLKDEPEPARKPSAPASPAKPTPPPGRRRP
jgi:hypothetical protein